MGAALPGGTGMGIVGELRPPVRPGWGEAGLREGDLGGAASAWGLPGAERSAGRDAGPGACLRAPGPGLPRPACPQRSPSRRRSHNK